MEPYVYAGVSGHFNEDQFTNRSRQVYQSNLRWRLGPMPYPAYYPPACPPPDAEPARELKVYRSVISDPPSSKCFEPPARRRKGKNWESTCEACATSVNLDLADLLRKRKELSGLRNHYPLIAVGYIRPGSGQVLADVVVNRECKDKSHVNWWIQVGYDPSADFSVMNLSPAV